MLTFRPRGGAPVAELTEDDLVLPRRRVAVPADARAGDRAAARGLARLHRRAAPTIAAPRSSRRLVGGAARVAHADLAVVTNDAAAERRADIWLQDLWAGRESAEFALPPSQLALTPGDVMALTLAAGGGCSNCARSSTPSSAQIEARSIDPEVFDLPLAAPRRRVAGAAGGGRAGARADCSTCRRLTGDDPPVLTRIAVFADPWPGPVAIWRSGDGAELRARGAGARARRSSARRSTICRPGRPAASIASTACACNSMAARSPRCPTCAVRRRQCRGGAARRRRLGGAAVRQRRAGRRAHL